jgi:hypothetical protein
VDHESRVHIDIEADDIPAEVARLEKLDATVVGRVKRWVVMQAPPANASASCRYSDPVFRRMLTAGTKELIFCTGRSGTPRGRQLRKRDLAQFGFAFPELIREARELQEKIG